MGGCYSCDHTAESPGINWSTIHAYKQRRDVYDLTTLPFSMRISFNNLFLFIHVIVPFIQEKPPYQQRILIVCNQRVRIPSLGPHA